MYNYILYIHVCDNQYLYLCTVYSMHIMYMYIIYGMIVMNCVTGSVNIGHLVANLIETIHEANRHYRVTSLNLLHSLLLIKSLKLKFNEYIL